MKLNRDDTEKVIEALEIACLGLHEKSPCAIFIPFEEKEETIEGNQFSMLLQEEAREGFAKVVKSGIIASSFGICTGYVESPITEINLLDYVRTLGTNTTLEENLEGLEAFLIRNSSILIFKKEKDYVK